MTGFIGELSKYLFDEKEARNAYLARVEMKAQKQILKVILAIGKTRDINLILQAEKIINNFHLHYYSNSKPMESSLNETINNLMATEKLVGYLQTNPGKYCIIAEGFTQSKNVSAGLPLDEARQYFRAQKTRFINMSKVDSNIEKKEIIDARKININIACDVYSNMQKLTLAQ